MASWSREPLAIGKKASGHLNHAKSQSVERKQILGKMLDGQIKCAVYVKKFTKKLDHY